MNALRNQRLSDSEVSDCISEERRFNQYLRQRRADAIDQGEHRSVIAQYDHMIFASDRRMLAMYAKNRRCGNIDG